MIGRLVLMSIIGLGGGMVIAGGVFALLTSTGIVTRMAVKTNTNSRVKIYESAISLGAILWNLFWVFDINMFTNLQVGFLINSSIGLLQGIFVGCLAVALSEMLNATSIFYRRIKLKRGVSILLLMVAVGKIAGSLIAFRK